MTGDRPMDELTADYARAGFSGRLGFGERPAVLVVDVVRAYLDRSSPLYAGVEDAVASAARVVDAARATLVPVVFTRVEFAPGGADGGLFYRKVPALRVFDRGSPLGAFPDDPRPREDEVVVTKQYASAFFGTALASTLTAMATDTVVVVGLSTSGCVRATAVDALQHGFAPIVVREAVGDRDRGVHDANLFDLQAKYADVVGERDVTTWLRGRG
jgi:nicotinamidase-related amidase